MEGEWRWVMRHDGLWNWAFIPAAAAGDAPPPPPPPPQPVPAPVDAGSAGTSPCADDASPTPVAQHRLAMAEEALEGLKRAVGKQQAALNSLAQAKSISRSPPPCSRQKCSSKESYPRMDGGSPLTQATTPGVASPPVSMARAAGESSAYVLNMLSHTRSLRVKVYLSPSGSFSVVHFREGTIVASVECRHVDDLAVQDHQVVVCLDPSTSSAASPLVFSGDRAREFGQTLARRAGLTKDHTESCIATQKQMLTGSMTPVTPPLWEEAHSPGSMRQTPHYTHQTTVKPRTGVRPSSTLLRNAEKKTTGYFTAAGVVSRVKGDTMTARGRNFGEIETEWDRLIGEANAGDVQPAAQRRGAAGAATKQTRAVVQRAIDVLKAPTRAANLLASEQATKSSRTRSPPPPLPPSSFARLSGNRGAGTGSGGGGGSGGFGVQWGGFTELDSTAETMLFAPTPRPAGETPSGHPRLVHRRQSRTINASIDEFLTDSRRQLSTPPYQNRGLTPPSKGAHIHQPPPMALSGNSPKSSMSAVVPPAATPKASSPPPGPPPPPKAPGAPPPPPGPPKGPPPPPPGAPKAPGPPPPPKAVPKKKAKANPGALLAELAQGGFKLKKTETVVKNNLPDMSLKEE